MSVRVGARVAPSTGVRKLRRPVATSSPSFNPLTDWTTGPVHGVWASDPLWTPPADGGAVSIWRNGGSVGTPNVTQAAGTKQPTYRASTPAFNNQPTVQGDGTDDFMSCGTADFAQPAYIVLIAAKGKSAASSEALIDRAAGAGICAIYTDATAGGTTWKASNGTTLLSGGTADTSPHLFNAVADGASSSLSVDGTSVATGNWSTTHHVGQTFFSGAGGASYFSSGHIALWLVFATNPTGQAEWASFKTWVTTTYGIAVA